jgi:hypothetical protein
MLMTDQKRGEEVYPGSILAGVWVAGPRTTLNRSVQVVGAGSY